MVLLLLACTAFCAANSKLVLVGNNEDYNNHNTRMWFVPGENGRYGRLYVGFDNMFPQGGMNERGLWFDGFATSPIEVIRSPKTRPAPVPLIEKVMSECATVEQVVRMLSGYDRDYLQRAILMFADATGDAAIIEANAILRKKGSFQVQTNFHQSLPKPEYDCRRFKTATAMLEKAGDDISVDLFRRILDATHAEGNYPTLYSNIYDLKRRVMVLYHMHDFNRAVTVDLQQELKKGRHVVEIPALFTSPARSSRPQ
jgi:hypothetical protein